MRLLRFLICIALPIFTGAAHAETDLKGLAVSITAKAHTNTEKVKAVITWAHGNLNWLATDYEERTVQQILARKGGNCDDNARVVVALLDVLNVKNRRTHEINIQPESKEREANAEAMVAKMGPKASVFGGRHNDHVWVEYWDEQRNEWAPADSTLNLVGYDEWIRARMGFGARIDSDVIASRDMIVPIAVFAIVRTPTGSVLEDRSERYLIKGFAETIPEAARAPEWDRWVHDVIDLQPKAKGAMEGTHNLHEDGDEIDAMLDIYERIKNSAGAPTGIKAGF